MTQNSDAIRLAMLTENIGVITLNQVEKCNALTAQMWSDLTARLKEAEANPDLKLLIVTGAGANFAAGADISEFKTLYATPETSAEISLKISTAIEALANFPRPTIAKIRGACVGGGAGIALACDLRFADTTSKYAITPGKLGLVYPFCDVRRLVQAVGPSNAKDILFSARLVDSTEAKAMGLIDRCLTPGALDEQVLNYAQLVCKTSQASVETTKKMFLSIAQGQSEETDVTEKWFLDAFSSDDFKEGYTAFMEKRKPQF